MTRRIELAPSGYTVRNVTAGTSATVTVPALTVAVAQASPTVGQTLTLTTNADEFSTYQWRRGTSDLAGATSATYVAQAADGGQSVSCRVTSGAQIVTSAGVTVAAAPTFSAAFAGFARDASAAGAASRTLVLDVGAEAADRVVYFGTSYDRGSGTENNRIRVNGGSLLTADAYIAGSAAEHTSIFRVPLPTGTTATVEMVDNAGASNILRGLQISAIRVVGAHTVEYVTKAHTGGTAWNIAGNTIAGDTLFVNASGRFGNGGANWSVPAGWTEHVGASGNAERPYNLVAQGAALGGTPETINFSFTGSGELSAILMRLRAA